MSIHPTHDVVCDQCSALHRSLARTVSQARHDARRIGWVRTQVAVDARKRMLDLCPDCWKSAPPAPARLTLQELREENERLRAALAEQVAS